MFFTKSFRPINIVLVVLSISAVFLTTHKVYFPLLALVSIVQSSIFIRDKNPLTASKYILYSAFFILCGSQLATGTEKQLLLILLTLKSFISSSEHEVENTNIFYSNIIIILSAGTLIDGFNSINLNTFIIALLLLACLRTILDKSIQSPAYIAPFFLILSLANPLYAIGIFVYIASLSFLIKIKEKVNGIILVSALCVVFVDSAIFYKVIPNILLNGAGWAISFLSACCVSIYIEKITKKELKNKINFTSIFLLIIALTSVCFIVFTDYSGNIFLNRPIPLASAILLVLLNGIYLKLFTKIKAQHLMTLIENKTEKFYRFTSSFFKSKHCKGVAKDKTKETKHFSLSVYFEKLVTKVNTSSLVGIFILSLVIMLIYLRWVA